MDKTDLKEKLIVLGAYSGIFLPIRIIFAAFVSDHWLGSVGLVSAFGVLMVVLIKKNKLGTFGKIFERQMKKTIGGKTGKYVIIFAVLFSLYFGTSLYLMERGNAIYLHDKEIFYEAIVNKEQFTIKDMPKESLYGPDTNEVLNLNYIAGLDYALSISFAIMNDVTNGWLSHLVVVIFVEQIEVVGLLFFYKKTYGKKHVILKEG